MTIITSPKYLRVAFVIHSLYFIFYALILDFLVSWFGGLFELPVPQTVIGWAATDIAAGELLAVASLFLLASFQKELPRFVLAVTLIQTTYNLYHDAVWFRQGYPFILVLIDTILIGTLFITYVLAWCTAKPLSLSRLSKK